MVVVCWGRRLATRTVKVWMCTDLSRHRLSCHFTTSIQVYRNKSVLGMSFMNPLSKGVPRTEEEKKTVLDAYGQEVTDKSANKPFLAYRQHKKREEEKAAAKVERKRRREEKIAKGEPLTEDDLDEYEDTACWALTKMLLWIVGTIVLSGWFFTGSAVWGVESKWLNLKTWIPTDQTAFSEIQLAAFDGTDPEKPIYLAIDSDVYDVSANRRTYGPGGSYHFMAGRDAARAFVTGCFQTHQTHDLRGLEKDELASLDHWKKFFAKSDKYTKVGWVHHAPINPKSPIPEPCEDFKKLRREKEATRIEKEQESKAKVERIAEKKKAAQAKKERKEEL